MYKVGDEVWVKVEITDVSDTDTYPYKIVCCEAEFADSNWVKEDTIADKTYEQGLADAWELAKKIYYAPCDGGLEQHEIEEIFGCKFGSVMFRYTAEEALAKIEAYERKSAIILGDEVEHDCNSFRTTFFVTYLNGNQIKGLDKTGNTHYFTMPNQYIKKTGKHIDIEGLLRQIGE